MKIFGAIFVFLIFVGFVEAIGISPARNSVNFVPSLEKEVGFTIVNSEGKDVNIVVAVQGELAQYVFIENGNFKMTAAENSKQFSFKVKLPAELEPGLHTAEIIVLQLPEEGQLKETFVGAAVAVVNELHVDVPYPGKYAEATLNIFGPGEDGKIAFIVPVNSKGKFDLVKVKATIDIFTSLNEKVATLQTNEIGIANGGRGEIVAEWDTSKAEPGPYRAIVSLTYDEETLTLNKEFNIGKKKLSLENIEVRDFKLGDIAKFNILVKNDWTQNIDDAFAQMVVFNNDGTVLADFKSPTYSVPAGEKTQMVLFWDTEGIRRGDYNTEFFLKYGESVDQKAFSLEVEEDKITIVAAGYVISKIDDDSGGMTKFLIGAIIFLIILNLSWFVFLRKKLRK